jgi:glycosyltransferase involved in cell wall biosynthesis
VDARWDEANPGIDLVMAGPDQSGLRPALEALAKRRRVASFVHATGPLYGEAKWEAACGSAAFALPSHQENFDIAFAEGQGCGTPVLTSDHIDIWREIEAASAGFVVPDTVEGTDAMLRRWREIDKPARARAASSAKPLFSEQFDVARTGPALIETIRALT